MEKITPPTDYLAFSSQDSPMQGNILLKTDYEDLMKLCTQKSIAKTCQDQSFWREKLRREFGDSLVYPNYRQRYKQVLLENLRDQLENNIGNKEDIKRRIYNIENNANIQIKSKLI